MSGGPPFGGRRGAPSRFSEGLAGGRGVGRRCLGGLVILLAAGQQRQHQPEQQQFPHGTPSSPDRGTTGPPLASIAVPRRAGKQLGALSKKGAARRVAAGTAA